MAINLFHFSEDGKFFRELDSIKQISGSPLKVTLFMYDERYNLISIFSKFKSESSIINGFEKIQEDDEKILYFCDIENENENEPVSVFFIVSKKEQIALLVSNQKSEEYKKCLSFFYNFYPFINRIFLRSHQILKLLTHVEEMNKTEIIARMYVAKRYFGKTKTEICHEKIGYKEVFNQVREDNLWVDSIYVQMLKDGVVKGKVRLNRKGIFSYSGFEFSELYRIFLNEAIIFFIETHLSFIKNKSRGINQIESKPLRLTLVDDVFTNEDSLKIFINRLKSLTNWGYSVISNDGIFAHIMMHDYTSGSSFDIYVSSSREIYIIPQTQVTEVSFNKLLSCILDNYEGELENV